MAIKSQLFAMIANPPARPTRFHEDDVIVLELEDLRKVLALSRSYDKLMFACLGLKKQHIVLNLLGLVQESA